ncbi:hypothetical protein ACVGXB_17190, partial [Enterobacter intestinihominis]
FYFVCVYIFCVFFYLFVWFVVGLFELLIVAVQMDQVVYLKLFFVYMEQHQVRVVGVVAGRLCGVFFLGVVRAPPPSRQSNGAILAPDTDA